MVFNIISQVRSFKMSNIELIKEGTETPFSKFRPDVKDTPVHYYVFEDSDKNRYIVFGAGWVSEEDKAVKPAVFKNMKTWFNLDSTEDEIEGTMNTFVPTHRIYHGSINILLQIGELYYYLKKVS